MSRYLLDTNIVSHLLKAHPAVSRRVAETQFPGICVSAITAGELAFGLAKRPEAVKLARAVQEFLRRVDILPWDQETAQSYGALKANLQRQQKTLAPLDLLIAAHAIHGDATLVTNDKAFFYVVGLKFEDWTLS